MSEAAQQSSEGGAPEWMVSYADMITIIMAFFVVLYATTSGSGKNDKGHEAAKKPEAGKETGTGATGDGDKNHAAADVQLQKVFDSLQYRFGPQWTIANCWTGGPLVLHQQGPAAKGNRKDGEKRAGKPWRRLPGRSGDASTPPEPGQSVVPCGRIYFDEFSAELSQQQKRRLRIAAEELAGKRQKFEIRGHTSTRPPPPGSAYRDHADLAYARCRTVEEYLATQGIDTRRMRLGVAGDNEPLETKGDPLRLQEDSRVEIHLLNEWVPGPAASADDP